MNSNLTQISVLTFGPVQAFLGGGQRLRDWAVASWLCHYLTAAIIYRWENQARGRVLLPLTVFFWFLAEKKVTRPSLNSHLSSLADSYFSS